MNRAALNPEAPLPAAKVINRILILAADDDPMPAQMLGEEQYTVIVGTRGEAAIEGARAGAALILLNEQLPDLDGLEICRRLKADPIAAAIPIILIAANQDPARDAQWLAAGAADVVIKPYCAAVLCARVNTQIALRQGRELLQQTERQLQRAYLELERLAGRDTLTGAWNRQRLQEAVAHEMERLRRYDHPLSLMILDIDDFKAINETYGDVAGDQVLAELAAIVRATLPAMDSLTRWGGGDFVVLNPNAALLPAAMMAEHLRETIANHVFAAVEHMTVSVGVAECLPGEDWAQWLKRADAALSRAKTGGGNQIQMAPERPRRAGLGENIAANFVQLHWRPIYECGHPVIDSQHRGLFDDANELLAAMLCDRPRDEIVTLIDRLIHHVARHFAAEEVIFTATGYPAAAAHAATHRGLLNQADMLLSQLQTGTRGTGDVFQFLARDLIALHILGSDREFFPYLAPTATGE